MFSFDFKHFFADIPNVLGLESGSVVDCQMTASSHHDTDTPSTARLNSADGWKPLVRGGPFCGSEFWQVCLVMINVI